MRKNIKAAFFDIDGTLLLNDTMYYAQSSLDAIHQLSQNGIKVALCTGRSLDELSSVPQAILSLPFDGIVVSAGGVALIDNQIIHEMKFSVEELRIILSVCKRHHLDVYFMDNQGSGLLSEPSELVVACIQAYQGAIPKVRAMDETSVHHLMIFCRESMDLLLRQEFCRLEYHRANRYCVDLYPQGVHKAVGMQAVCDVWGITLQDCMAFGDSFNDIEMIERVGLGIAMGNGSARIKEVADYVCEDINQDGIYLACKQFGLI